MTFESGFLHLFIQIMGCFVAKGNSINFFCTFTRRRDFLTGGIWCGIPKYIKKCKNTRYTESTLLKESTLLNCKNMSFTVNIGTTKQLKKNFRRDRWWKFYLMNVI